MKFNIDTQAEKNEIHFTFVVNWNDPEWKKEMEKILSVFESKSKSKDK